MTKKDFVLIAGVIKDSFDVPQSDSEYYFIHRMANKLDETNPRFDKDRFLLACGIEECEMCEKYPSQNEGLCSRCIEECKKYN